MKNERPNTKPRSNLRLTCLAFGALALSSTALFAATPPKLEDQRGKTATATATGLKAGERVRINYTGSGDLPTMQRVRIAPAKAAKS